MSATPDPTVLRPERFVAGGEAFAHDAEGRVVFVRGGVPGDEVAVETIEDKGDWARAVVTDVVTAGADRVVPPCPRRREGCGGCDWQHLDVPAQLPAKTEIVRDALRRTGKLPDAIVRVGGSVRPDGYRTTIRVIGDDQRSAAFREDRSHATVSAAGCLVAHPNLLPVIERMEIPTGVEVTLRTSNSTGEVTARWDRSKGDVAGLGADIITGPHAALVEQVAGHRFQVSASSFFQSGPDAARLLVGAVRRAAPELDGADRVVDAYAGVGLFAVAAAETAHHVITIETSRSAVADCRVNLRDRAARVEQGQVGRWRPDHRQPVDVVIADPARSGLGRPGVATIVATQAAVLALVSCDPVAMARDAALLGRHGYRHAGTEVLDVFPHTHHVECVTRFVRD